MPNLSHDIDQLARRLIAYLRDELNNTAVDYAAPLTQLQGGNETATYRFQLQGVCAELAAPLVLRLYPPYFGADNALWESTVQNLLAGEGFPVAQAHLVCADLSILGGAFFIMAFLPGEPLLNALGAYPISGDTLAEQVETLDAVPEHGTHPNVALAGVPAILGQSQAALHQIDPTSLIHKLREQGVGAARYRLDRHFAWLAARAGKLPWLGESVRWLVGHRPSEPTQLAICHGDFHPLNLLTQAGKVTGVLDWPNFLIADPVLDVATTIVLITIPFKHIAATTADFATVDWNLFVQHYLDAYRAQRALHDEHLAYYRVKRCIHALIEGWDGQKIWQQPLIVKDLIGYVHAVTDLTIHVPD
ncbi:MAG: phosphotransferase family protein [Caldilineaceae bacterium]